MSDEELKADQLDAEEDAKRKEADKAKRRDQVAQIMSGPLAMILGTTAQRFGVDVVLNAAMDVVCALASTSFDEERTPAILAAMALRVADTDWKRHRARLFEGRLAVVPGDKRSDGGIVLPK